MLKKPESMDECVYFTRRTIGNEKVMVWVFRELCPKCKKGVMGKPVEKGKVKIRAKEYVCPECNHKIGNNEYEDGLTANIEYTCSCGFKGEIQVPFKRKRIKGVETLRFQCQKCNKNIDVTKKMKQKK